MNSKVKLSTLSIIITAAVAGLMVFLAFASFQDKQSFYVLVSLILILIISGLFFAPVAIAADGKEVMIKAPLNKLSIPMEDIASVEYFQPMMSPVRTMRIRLFASGGFLGYWGVFYDPVIGKFNGYFGDSKSCFLLTKKNGDKYVLGCEKSEEMVKYIQNQLK